MLELLGIVFGGASRLGQYWMEVCLRRERGSSGGAI